MKRSGTKQENGTASQLISRQIAELDDWRGETLAQVRALIKAADPDIVEELKWMGTPVWSHDGIVCTGETYKTHVKLTFAKGAFLKDPAGLFNSSLEGNLRRAIDIRQGEKIKTAALKALLRAAVELNVSLKKPSRPKRGAATPKAAPKKAAAPKRTAAGTPKASARKATAPKRATTTPKASAKKPARTKRAAR